MVIPSFCLQEEEDFVSTSRASFCQFVLSITGLAISVGALVITYETGWAWLSFTRLGGVFVLLEILFIL